MRGKYGSVVVFLGGLPADLTARELRTFVQNVIQGEGKRRLRIGRSICHCSILRITDLDTGEIDLHGLVEIRPAVLAMQAIERLHGVELLGQRITARRYRQRSPLGSRRPPAPPGVNDANDRETAAGPAERRRRNLKIELASGERDFFDSLTAPLRWPWGFWSTKPSGSTAR